MGVNPLDSAVVAPVLDEALGLAEEAILNQQDSQEKIAAKDRCIADLQRQLADRDKVILEKVAGAPTLDPVALDRLLDRFEDLKIMASHERTKLASHIRRDPNLIFPLFYKAADLLSGAPAEGGGIGREDSSESQGDPDGWDDFANGKVVQIR